MNFNKMGLMPEILDAIASRGYEKATPIQEQAIPAVLKGKDVLGGAQTGTGKTAAFALPILDKLSREEKRIGQPRSLILVPTRELADQVGESFKDYGTNLTLRSAAIYGGVSIKPQVTAFKKGLDIVIATPGRLLDHLDQKNVSLSRIEILVLDEADRMLDMGFIRDIRRILKYLPEKRQNLMFSATYDKDIRKLADSFLKNPISVEVAKRNMAADKVEQKVHPIDKGQKRHLLAHLIKTEGWYQVLVFVRTKHGANRLSKQLEKEQIPSAAIHGDKSQGARTRALDQFKKGKLQALIATDVAARGIHLEELTHVVNFDLPQVPEDYVHRIGRTGRAGKSGIAVSFVSPEEKSLLVRIERMLKTTLPKFSDKSFVPVPVTNRGMDSPMRPQQGNRQNRGNRRRSM